MPGLNGFRNKQYLSPVKYLERGNFLAPGIYLNDKPGLYCAGIGLPDEAISVHPGSAPWPLVVSELVSPL